MRPSFACTTAWGNHGDMAWFPWRKKTEEVNVPQPVAPAAAPEVQVPAPVAVEPVAVEPVVEEPVEVEPVVEELVVTEPVVTEPTVIVPAVTEPTVIVPVAVEPAVVAQPIVVEPVAAVQPAVAPTAGAVWNPTVGGVVVTIDASQVSGGDAATAVREGIERALALAVGPDSPAPADASEDFPIVLAITIAADAGSEVDETIAAARKQLARKAGRVRLVVDEV